MKLYRYANRRNISARTRALIALLLAILVGSMMSTAPPPADAAGDVDAMDDRRRSRVLHGMGVSTSA